MAAFWAPTGRRVSRLARLWSEVGEANAERDRCKVASERAEKELKKVQQELDKISESHGQKHAELIRQTKKSDEVHSENKNLLAKMEKNEEAIKNITTLEGKLGYLEEENSRLRILLSSG